MRGSTTRISRHISKVEALIADFFEKHVSSIIRIAVIGAVLFIFSGGILAVTESLYGRISPFATFTRGAITQSIFETIIYLIINAIIVAGFYLVVRSARRKPIDTLTLLTGSLLVLTGLLVAVYVVFHMKLAIF